MKKGRVLLAAVVLAVSCVLVASAQPRKAVARLVKGLNLTDAQKSAIKAIRDDTREAVQKAGTPADKQTLVKAAREQIKALLTPEQLAKLQKMRQARGKSRSGIAAAAEAAADLDLTDAQKASIKAIRENARQAVQDASSPADKRAIIKSEREQIKALLTPEQIAALAAGHENNIRPSQQMAARLLAQLNLTPDQKAAIQTIRETTRQAVQAAATPADKRALVQSAWQQIKALLTPEQLAKLAKIRDRK